MRDNTPQNKPPPKTVHRISPQEQEWLDNLLRQLKYDERMQAERERWLWERPRSNDATGK